MDVTEPAPSGTCLPLFLRQKWKEQNEEGSSTAGCPLSITEQYPQITRAEKNRSMSRIFSSKEIEDRIQRISKHSLVDIQRMIHRGEETYFEDTNGHGNLFRGWDTFVDSRDVLGSAGASLAPQGGGSRRMPADNRWFASSCTSFSKSNRPPSSLSSGLPPIRSATAASVSEQPPSAAAPSVSFDSGHLPVVAPDVSMSERSLMVKQASAVEAPQADTANDPAADAAVVASSSIQTAEEAETKQKTPSMKRKREETKIDDEDDEKVEPEAKKLVVVSSMDDSLQPKDEEMDEQNAEDEEEAPNTPIFSKKEDKSPMHTDSQKRRSSRRKAG